MMRICAITVFVALAFGVAGCHPDVGERCNPLRFTDDCPSGTACTYPPNCGVAYCCPTASPFSDPANTIPSCVACPADDPGSATDAAASD